MTVAHIAASPCGVRRTVVVNASAATLLDLVADPQPHGEFGALPAKSLDLFGSSRKKASAIEATFLQLKELYP